MSQDLDSQLIGTVRNLGSVLGDTIRDQLGEQWLERIEAVRKDGRKAHQGDEDCAQRVKQLFSELKRTLIRRSLLRSKTNWPLCCGQQSSIT